MTNSRQLLLYSVAPNTTEGDFAAVAQLLDALAMPVSYSDRDCRYLYVNEVLASRLRLERSQMIGRSYAELYGSVAFESRRGVFERVLSGEQVSEELHLHSGLAYASWWHLDYYPNRNRSGEVVGYYVFSREITAAKELQRTLAARGEEVRKLVESIMIPMARWDRSARIVYCNSPYEQWIGRPRAEIFGKTHAELFGAAAWAVSRTSFEKAFTGLPTTYERQVRRNANELRWHRVHVFPDELGHDAPETVFTIAFDIDDDIRLRQQLAANEARLRSILESTELPIARVDPQYRFTYCNGQFARYVGKDHDTLIGKTILDSFGHEVFAQVREHYDRGFSGETVTFDRQATHGETRWVRIRLTPERDASGRTNSLLVTVYDIEAEVRALEKLDEARNRLDIFTDNLPFPLTHLDRDGYYRFANREFLDRHGLSREQVIGHHPIEARGEKVWQEYRPYFEAAINGTLASYERPIRLADGSVRWTRTVYAPGRSAEGTIAGVYTTSYDVHELRAAQEEIARVHAQLRAHLDGSPVAVVEYDATGTIVQWSRRTEELLGIAASEMIGKRITLDVAHPDDRAEIEAVVARIMAPGSSIVTNTHRYRHRAGHYVWIEWHTTIMRDAKGDIQSILSLGVDMQERMESRLKLQRLADRIPNPITYLGTDSRYQVVNTTFVAWTGIAARDMIGRTVTEVRGANLGTVFQSLIDRALRGEECSIERMATLASGAERWIKTVITPDFDESGRIVGCYNVSFDVHDAKLLQQSLQAAADRDPLTGAMTRRAFFTEFDRRLDSADGAVVCVFFADFDGFKEINDRLGHAEGDRVLVEAVSHIRSCTRDDDLIGRLGGDEMAVVTRAATQTDAREFAERVIASVSSIRIDQHPELRLAVSIGIAMSLCREGGETSDQLLRRADQAMYEAKREGGGRLRFAY
jgi:diguanylate cyclase (GGDEF)-like protein/PAS domain S-box-containing protein